MYITDRIEWLPEHVQRAIEESNYEFDYAIEYEDYYVLCTSSGYRYDVVDK